MAKNSDFSRSRAGRGSGRGWRAWLAAAVYAAAAAIAAATIPAAVPPKITYASATQAASPQPACSTFGVATSAVWWHKTAEEVRDGYAMARSVGACAVRIGVMWNEIEKSPGHYDWAALDKLTLGARDAGITPMFMIYASPEWWLNDTRVRELAGLSSATPLSVVGSSVVAPAAPEEDLNEKRARIFGDFVAQLAGRYGGQVDAYEIWNEPNTPRFWSRPNIDHYVMLLKSAYPRIHEADPGATVVSAGMAPAPDSPTTIAPQTFIRGLYERGAQDWFDALGMHPYTWRDAPDQRHRFRDMEEVLALMDAFGDTGTSVWVTEFGAPTGGFGGITQAEQADLFRWGIREAEAHPRIAALYLYSVHDCPAGVTNPESYFGMFTSTGQAKVAASTLRADLATPGF